MICKALTISSISFILLMDLKPKPIGMLDAQEPKTESLKKCGVSTEIGMCSKTERDRFGCCSNKWENKKSCDNESDTENCKGLIETTCMKTFHGTFECRHQETKYHGVNINESSSRSTLLPRIGKVCNPQLYNKRMRPIWERYLLCPFDYETYNKDLEEFLDGWHYHDEIMDDVCFSSLIEQCNPSTNKCECFKKTFKKSDGVTVLLDFQQHLEGADYCGQLAGQTCTHNVKVIKDVELQDGTHCKVKSPKSMPVPEIFKCESDAGCDLLLEKGKFCPVDKTCKCVCASGFSCIGNSAETIIMNGAFWTKLYYLTIMITISFLIS